MRNVSVREREREETEIKGNEVQHNYSETTLLFPSGKY